MLEIQLVFVLCIHIYENVPRALKPYVFFAHTGIYNPMKNDPFQIYLVIPSGCSLTFLSNLN